MSTKNVTILDYGMANLLNVARAFEHCGASVTVTDRPNIAASASRLVVPGVGAFEAVLKEIRTHGYDDSIRSFLESDRPFLGICVGMQMLFDFSEEFGEHPGLGILPGRVKRISGSNTTGESQRVPHVGWSHLVAPLKNSPASRTGLCSGELQSAAFYFVHSYAVQPDVDSDRLADYLYGGHRICAAVQRGNLVATQFHPERSGPAGLEFIREFLRW